MKRKTVALLMVITLAGVDPAAASKGEKAFADGDFLAASKFYAEALKKNPSDPSLHYNSGTAAYKNNLFDDAIASFSEALKSEDLGLQEKSYYNLGQSLFRKGEELLQSDSDQAAKLWQQALDAYDGSLKLNPKAGDARENRDLVTRRLEELKKQQEKQNQDKQQQDKNDKQKQEKQQEQQKEQEQAGDQQDKDEKEGQPEKQDDQGQQQGKDPAAAQNESSPPEKNSGDQAGDSKEQSADKPAGKEQQPEQTEGGQVAEAQNDERQQKESAGAPAAQQGQDEERRRLGKMTNDEARQLLNRLKNEERRLNFVPQPENGEAGKEGTWKDW
jgi:Ca-activated chloride channel family protein